MLWLNDENMKNKIILYSCLIILGTFICAKNTSEDKNKEDKSERTTTSKITIVLDGKRISNELLDQKYTIGEAKYIGGSLDPRVAIYLYGEKYRNGIQFFESKNKEVLEN